MVRLMHEGLEKETAGYNSWRSMVKNSFEAIGEVKPVRTAFKEWFKDYAWPGGYTVIHCTDSGDVLCANCALREFLTGVDVTSGTYDEGPMMFCDECNKEIESSYGDPEDDE